MMPDTSWTTDTIKLGRVVDGKKLEKDSFQYVKRMTGVTQKKIEREVFIPEPGYGDLFKNKVNPLAAEAKKAGWKVYAISTIGDGKVAGSLAEKTGADYPFYRADDKLLKTIIRANPGIVVWKDGKVLDMYHHRHIPDWNSLFAKWK